MRAPPDRQASCVSFTLWRLADKRGETHLHFAGPRARRFVPDPGDIHCNVRPVAATWITAGGHGRVSRNQSSDLLQQCVDLIPGLCQRLGAGLNLSTFSLEERVERPALVRLAFNGLLNLLNFGATLGDPRLQHPEFRSRQPHCRRARGFRLFKFATKFTKLPADGLFFHFCLDQRRGMHADLIFQFCQGHAVNG